jgi:hypothetical protein
MQNLGDDFLGNSVTQKPIYARGNLHVRDTQYLAVLVDDRLYIGREVGLVWRRGRVGVHGRRLQPGVESVTGTSFLVLSWICPIEMEPRTSGVGDGDRTRDIRCHRPTLYQLSYAHRRINTGQFTLKPASIEMGGGPEWSRDHARLFGRDRFCDLSIWLSGKH